MSAIELGHWRPGGSRLRISPVRRGAFALPGLVAVLVATSCGGAAGPHTATVSPSPALGCSSSTATLGSLEQPNATVAVPGSPFGVVPIIGTDSVVVSSTPSGEGGQLNVLQVGSGATRLAGC